MTKFYPPYFVAATVVTCAAESWDRWEKMSLYLACCNITLCPASTIVGQAFVCLNSCKNSSKICLIKTPNIPTVRLMAGHEWISTKDRRKLPISKCWKKKNHFHFVIHNSVNQVPAVYLTSWGSYRWELCMEGKISEESLNYFHLNTLVGLLFPWNQNR
jgi:hypothetical protein